MDVASPPYLRVETSANKVLFYPSFVVGSITLSIYLFLVSCIIFSHEPYLRSRLDLLCKEWDGFKIQSIVIIIYSRFLFGI